MDDLISRQAAIEIATQEGAYGYISAQELSELPSAQKKGEWIPCSERLPSDEDYDETFIVTIQCEHYDGWDDYVTGYADWTPHGWDMQINQSYYLGVIAWMPLPEPYKGDNNG